MLMGLNLGTDLINKIKQIILDTSYPIGRVITSVENTNPGTYLGGTWVPFGSGRTLVGVDIDQTEFDSIEKTGGSKYLQEHGHDLRYKLGSTGSSNNWVVDAGNTSNGYVTSAGNNAIKTSGTGNSGNLQPYITVYFWKRTA